MIRWQDCNNLYSPNKLVVANAPAFDTYNQLLLTAELHGYFWLLQDADRA